MAQLRHAWLVATVGMFAFCACAQVIGLEDVSVVTTSTGGGSSVGATGGTPACDPDPALVKACVLEVSCDPGVPFWYMSTCVTYDSLTSCARNIQSCGEYAACTGRRLEPASACSAGETGWKCTSQYVAVLCPSSGTPLSIDCSKRGGVCDPYVQAGGTDYFPCRLDPVASCTDTDPTITHCNGNFNYNCLDGKQYGRQCNRPEYSGTCVEPTAGKAVCTPGTETCTDPGVYRCSGGPSGSLCTSDGYRFDVNCARGGATCNTSATTDAELCTAKTGCLSSTGSCTEQCAGSVMNVCVHGVPYPVDCKGYGYANCYKWTNPSKSTDFYVYCGN